MFLGMWPKSRHCRDSYLARRIKSDRATKKPTYITISVLIGICFCAILTRRVLSRGQGVAQDRSNLANSQAVDEETEELFPPLLYEVRLLVESSIQDESDIVVRQTFMPDGPSLQVFLPVSDLPELRSSPFPLSRTPGKHYLFL